MNVEDNSTNEDLFAHIFECLKPLRLKLNSRKNGLSLMGERLYFKDFSSYITSDVRRKFSFFEDPTPLLFSEFIDYAIEKLKTMKEHVSVREDFLKYSIAVDRLTGNHYVLEDDHLSPLDYTYWKTSIKEKSEDEFDILYTTRNEMVVTFDPHKPHKFESSIQMPGKSLPVTYYNSYIHPPWKHLNTEENEIDTSHYELIDRFIPDFLSHFIPKEDERQYVLHWLYSLMDRRCQDVLVLIGVQGNGKNTLMELATIIAGRQNTIVGSKAFGRDKFNSEVCRRKLVNLDEFSIKGSAKESLKCFTNDSITVEMKGQDPVMYENHCSFIVANNSMKSVEFEYKDRRFTCPTLGETDLANVWDETKLWAFKELIKTEKFQLYFPWWLKREVESKKIEFNAARPYITPYFRQLCEISKPDWFKTFKRLLEIKETVNAHDIYKENRLKVSNDKIQDLLIAETEERRFLKKDPWQIASQIVDENGKVNYSSHIFKPEDN